MTDLLTLTNHHPGFRCSLQWAPTDKDLSFLGSCPFAKGPFTNIPLYATPLRWEKHPHRGLTSSGHVCGHRSEQEIRVHFNVCSTSATVGGCPWSCSLDGHLLSRSTLCSGPSCLCPVLPVPGSACVPSCQSRLCLCPACLSQALPVSCLCSERSSSVLLPSLLPCTPLWAPPTLGALMICMALAAIGNGLLWPLSRRVGPWLVSHHCAPRATNGLGTQQAVHTLCGMHASTSEGPIKDEPLHFSLLTVAPQLEPSLYSETTGLGPLSHWCLTVHLETRVNPFRPGSHGYMG